MKMDIKQIKILKGKRKITVLTAYDFPTASIVDKAGIDIILVGDSLANVVLGLESTTQVGMAEMLHHAKAVRRGVKNALLVGDMPYSAYQPNPEEAVENARKFIEEAGCQAVKIEWFDRAPEVTQAIIEFGIPVMGHIGLTPQTADKLGGFKVQGKDALAAKRLIEQAQEFERQGCFAVVLECIPSALSGLISKKVRIPTISCGAGVDCDGQVLVITDLLGLTQGHRPKFVKQYADLSAVILEAVKAFKEEVTRERFPGPEHSFTMKEEELKKIDDR
jgi:3-methyl-2-oxobutanoate hydroxymethyltransferase